MGELELLFELGHRILVMVILSRSGVLLAFCSNMRALNIHLDLGMNLTQLVDSKKLSNLTWNCGDTRPVLMDRTMCTDLECVGKGPRYILILLLFSHLPNVCPCCNAFSRTYTGHPKGCSDPKSGDISPLSRFCLSESGSTISRHLSLVLMVWEFISIANFSYFRYVGIVLMNPQLLSLSRVTCLDNFPPSQNSIILLCLIIQ